MHNDNYKDRFNSLKGINNNEEFLNKFINMISEILYERDNFVSNSNNDSLREEFYNNILRKTILNMYNNIDNINLSEDIEFIGSGHSSLVFKIGDNAFKIEKSNNKKDLLKYDKYDCVIPVLYDSSFEVDYKEIYNIIITPLVDTLDIFEEDVYETYKRLRDLGYIWNDPKRENVGRIIQDIEHNGHYYKTGDLVIIDFAYVGEITPEEVLAEIAWTSYNSKTYEYEMRYIREKEKTR